MRVTLASIGDAVITTDTQRRVTFLNAVAESLTGWKIAEAAGQPLETVFHIVNENTRQPVESPATRVLRDGVIVGLANHTVLIAKDGTEGPIDDSAGPIKDDQGGSRGRADLPGHHRAEAAGEGVAAGGRPMSEADRRKNEFLAMLAHELRNPLAPIRNAVQSPAADGRRCAGRQLRRPR